MPFLQFLALRIPLTKVYHLTKFCKNLMNFQKKSWEKSLITKRHNFTYALLHCVNKQSLKKEDPIRFCQKGISALVPPELNSFY